MSTQDTLAARYDGKGRSLFGLALRTSLLTLLTLGFYRFWAKTRIRRYLWSSTRIGDDRFEYTGTGTEKLLGFLIALLVLTVSLALAQLLLFFFGLSAFRIPRSEADIVIMMVSGYLSLLLITPLLYAAAYRARRYRLARTRLRGIRFAMEPGAWGYTWRAIGHSLLTLLTLGILLPRQTFWLEKYQADRSWYGDARFHQGGTWTALYAAMTHIFIGLGLIAVAALAGFATSSAILGWALGAVGVTWLFIGHIHYGVKSFAILTNAKRLGDEVRFHTAPSTLRIVGRVLLGSVGVGVVFFLCVFAILTPAIGALIWSGGPSAQAMESYIVAFTLLAYLIAFVLTNALVLALITQPVIAHLVASTTVLNPAALDSLRQREADRGVDAEGFADALDVGAAV